MADLKGKHICTKNVSDYICLKSIVVHTFNVVEHFLQLSKTV